MRELQVRDVVSSASRERDDVVDTCVRGVHMLATEGAEPLETLTELAERNAAAKGVPPEVVS
jgi:hypothetical protein